VSAKPPESPAITGRLSETPLFVVLRRIQRERLSGTLSVFRDDQVRQLMFENGELIAARSSREEHRIGATLVRWGYISEKDLEDALAAQRQTHERIDRILVGQGRVTRAVVDSEARRQMEQIVFSTLSWPDGSFHFEADTGPVELDVAVSLSQEMIIEGIRRIPESEQFQELLGDPSAVPVLAHDATSSGSLGLLRDAFEVLSQVDGKRSTRELLEMAATSPSARAKVLYSLLFAGIIEMKSEPGAGGEPRAAARAAAAQSLVATQPTRAAGVAPPTSRQIVLDTYGQLDWLSHYDLLGVSRKAEPKEIEAAYRARSRLFDPSLKAHPELVDLWRQLTVLAKWLQVAYDVLSNREAREAYDKKITEAIPGAFEP
jgi:hypothetical protein